MLDWVRQEYRHITPYVPGKSEQDARRETQLQRIVKLASNENPAGPSPRVRAAIAAAAERVHIYPDSDGTALRQRLAAHLGVHADEILLGNGSNSLLEVIARVCLLPGDELLVPTPSFVAYGMAGRWSGATITAVPLTPTLEYDIEAVLGAATAATKLLFLANPNNPTGTYVPREALTRLLRELPARVLVVVDEAYFEYAVAGDYPDALGLRRERARLLVLRTFSKAHGLAGLRVGYAVGPAELVACLHHARMPFCVNGIALAAAEAALDDAQALTRVRDDNRAQMARLVDHLQRHGLRFVPSQANFVLVQFPQGEAVNLALLQRGVVVRSMQSYGLPGWQRISIGSEADTDALLAALAAL